MGVRTALVTFCQTTSIKGLPKVIRPQAICLRMLWAFCVLFGATMAFYQLTSIFRAYLRYETSTIIMELEKEPPVFPDVTVCKVNPPEFPGEDSGLTLPNYLNALGHLIENANSHERDTLEELYSLDGYFQTISDKYFVNCTGEKFTTECQFADERGTDTPCYQYNHSVRFLTPSYPTCITFKIPDLKSRQATRAMSAIFYLDDFHPTVVPNYGSDASFPQSSGVVIFVHPPNTLPNIFSGVTGSPGWETSIRLREERRQRALDPYSTCNTEGYDDVIDHSDFSYTERGCRNNCSQSRSISECACLDARFPTTTAQRKVYPFCGHLESSKDTMVSRMRCVLNRTDSVTDRCDEKCVEKCLTLKYHCQTGSAVWPHESRQLAFYRRYIKGRQYPANFNIYDDIQSEIKHSPGMAYERLHSASLIRRNFLKVRVFFGGESVILLRDTPLHTAESVSGSLGGILNLWIGISFVTVIEIGELFYNLATVLFKDDEAATRDRRSAIV